jgi:hypothetical protein
MLRQLSGPSRPAAAVRLFRRNETVSVLAAAGHRSRLVVCTSDGKRYWVAARRLRPLIRDDWRWKLP